MKTHQHSADLMMHLVARAGGQSELLASVKTLTPAFFRSLLTGIKPIPPRMALTLSKEFDVPLSAFIEAFLADEKARYMSRTKRKRAIK